MGITNCLKCGKAYFDFELGEMLCFKLGEEKFGRQTIIKKPLNACECPKCEPYCKQCAAAKRADIEGL